jgi:hypothetical protein
VNAPRRLVPMRLLDRVTRQLKTKTRKIEFVTIRSKCAPGATMMCGNLRVQKVESALQQEERYSLNSDRRESSSTWLSAASQ